MDCCQRIDVLEVMLQLFMQQSYAGYLALVSTRGLCKPIDISIQMRFCQPYGWVNHHMLQTELDIKLAQPLNILSA